MAWQRDRRRTLIIEFGALKVMGNLKGVDRVEFDGTADARRAVAGRLRAMKAEVDYSGPHWLRAGAFPDALRALTRQDLDLPEN